MAVGVRPSSSAASLKLRRRAAASNARSVAKGGSGFIEVVIDEFLSSCS
jgi:hypothetical protein